MKVNRLLLLILNVDYREGLGFRTLTRFLVTLPDLKGLKDFYRRGIQCKRDYFRLKMFLMISAAYLLEIFLMKAGKSIWD